MNKKRILALMMGAIIASGGISQMAVQVYADDEEQTRISESMEDTSYAEPLTKFEAFKSGRAEWSYYCNGLKLNLSNLYVSASGLIFEPMENMEAKLVCFDAGKRPKIREVLEGGSYADSSDDEYFLDDEYSLDDEETYDKDITVPQNVKIGGETYKVTSIGDRAFDKCYFLENVILPASLNKIGEYAFNDCESLSLEELPKGITEIGEGAFWDCRCLRLEALPEGLTRIDKRAFMGCVRLQLKELPAGVTEIGRDAFRYCESLQLKELPENLRVIDGSAFKGCKMLELKELPANLREIGRKAFKDTAIEDITIPYGVYFLGRDAFDTHTIGEITLEKGSSLKGIDIVHAYGCQFTLSDPSMLKLIEEESTEEESIEEVEEIEEEEEEGSSSEWEPETGLIVSDEPSSYEWDC